MFTKFLSGYLTEYSLSVDNLFVFIMIFSLMAVHEKNQPKLLKLGILLSGELNGAPFVQQNARIRIPGIRYSTQMGRLCMSLRVQLVISPR